MNDDCYYLTREELKIVREALKDHADEIFRHLAIEKPDKEIEGTLRERVQIIDKLLKVHLAPRDIKD